MASYPSLRDRQVLVTGGGAGIGAATVEAFVAQGARVAFLDRDATAAAGAGGLRCGPGGRFWGCGGSRRGPCSRGDHFRRGVLPTYEVCDLADLPAALAAVRRLASVAGDFRALVNNAGDDAPHAFVDVTPEQFDSRIAVNLRHQFFLAQAVAPGMAAAGGGSIVNLGSISWMIGVVGVPAYATAKAGVEGLTRALARELGPDAIRVNSIAPGWVLTERQRIKGAADPSKFTDYLARQAIKEHLEPVDVAEMALWLCADESRRCTGQTWFVDAGAS